MRIGICGGTFDPFHRGHLDPVLAVRGEMQWDRILYIPAHRQPFKLAVNSANDWHRYAMVILATLDHYDVYASDIELSRGEVSYTVDTLEKLRAEHPGATLDWIIGDDNLAKLDEWKNLDRIFELANFAVLARGREEGRQECLPHTLPVWARHSCLASERAQNGSIVMLHNPLAEVSATGIRNRIRAGQPIDDLVDPRVARYIEHYGLYKGTP